MAHPYKSAAHKNDPHWVSALADDITATLRNHGGDPKITSKAAYEPNRAMGGRVHRAPGGPVQDKDFAGGIENRGPDKAQPGPGPGSYRGSKYEKDDNSHGERVYEPMGQDTGLSVAATKSWNYKGRSTGGRNK